MTGMSTTGLHRDQLSPGQLAGYELARHELARHELARHDLGRHELAQHDLAQHQPATEPRPHHPAPRWPALRRAGDLLVEARGEAEGARRFALARLSALTTALAVSAGTVEDLARARAAGPWALFALARPELAHWAEVFAASDRQWAAICRGGVGPDGAADVLVVQADAFRMAVLSEAVVTDPP